MLMKDKYRHLRKVHFTEIPSIKYLNEHIITFKDGLHVYLTNNQGDQHKVYISERFTIDISYLQRSKLNYSVYDLTAYYVYVYLLRLSFTQSQWKVLWKLLRYSNDLILTIRKFLEILELT